MHSNDGYGWAEPTDTSPTTTSIIIDTSISITGDGNTVTLASPRPGALADRATQAIKATNTTTAGPDPEQDKTLQLTSTIIHTLNSYSLTDDNGRKTPVIIEVKRGITVQGSNNKVHITDSRIQPETSGDWGTADHNHTNRTPSWSVGSDRGEPTDHAEFKEEDNQQWGVKDRRHSHEWF